VEVFISLMNRGRLVMLLVWEFTNNLAKLMPSLKLSRLRLGYIYKTINCEELPTHNACYS
jgi:hypothetical protein